MRKDIDGFDIEAFDLDDLLMQNGMIDEFMYLQNVRNRRLFLNGEIKEKNVGDVVRNILKYNAEDKGIPTEERKPVLLYISSEGGDVDSGFTLIDVVENSKTPVYVVNLGYCYSMAFIIYLAGHKRYATKNSKFMVHDGNSYVGGSTGKAKDTMDFIEAIEKRVKAYIVSRTKISAQKYTKNFRREWYMYADEAKSYGVCDSILGEDVDIDDIS